ncbi:hypothetical protein BH11PLA2_BH11PLA2_19050 [soil metagenome]
MNPPEVLPAGEDPFDLTRLCRYFSERSPQPMIAVEGLSHIIRYLNPAFCRIAGKSSGELLGRRFADAVPEGADNACVKLLDRVFHSGEPENLAEQQHRQSQPMPVYWSYAVWPILDADDRPAGVMIHVTDTTEMAIFRSQSRGMNESLVVSSVKQHELTEHARSLSIKLQAAVKTRDHFLAVLSHELRNPLAALSTGINLLKLTNDDPVRAGDCRTMMERQLKQMVHLVDDLLDVSRITTGKLTLRKERVTLSAVLTAAVEASRPLIDVGGHELTLTQPSTPILLDADPLRLGQVFQNMLNNAAKYSEPGGHIRLSVQQFGNEVEVRVRDTGIGIAAEFLPHVFEVFVQADTAWQQTQGGLGIGLSLVKEFVALHDGRVEVRSSGPGTGSEFIVRLPLARTERDDDASPAAPTIARQVQRRILIVDDNRDAAETLSMLLGILGHDVRTAHDGYAGVIAAEEFRPDLVLMDLGMPRFNGYEAARQIRAKPWGRGPFLVALTGWGADDDRRKTQDAGFDRHLVKPVDSDDLVKIIAEIPVNSAGFAATAG